MPELPEIEHLRRTLDPLIRAATVQNVSVTRRDVIHTFRSNGIRSNVSRALLVGSRVELLERRGKQLAISAVDGRTICLHLGMSGQLRWITHHEELPCWKHVHCRWELRSGNRRGLLVFRDPRRFGGIWTYPTREVLIAERWCRLGPDGLTIRASRMRALLGESRRPVKSLLLDQTKISGIGNIYADEALFRAAVHPASTARALPSDVSSRLAASIRAVLRDAIQRGGSTLTDYVDATGRPGTYRDRHAVYGRAGQPCRRCSETLRLAILAGRSTVFCPGCQLHF